MRLFQRPQLTKALSCSDKTCPAHHEPEGVKFIVMINVVIIIISIIIITTTVITTIIITITIVLLLFFYFIYFILFLFSCRAEHWSDADAQHRLVQAIHW